jgi:flagellar FliJ protein
MKRTTQLRPVQRVLEDGERSRARELGAAQQQVGAAEHKLRELQQYRQDYMRAFEDRARRGHSIVALRDFQAFLARLDAALKQQAAVVESAKVSLSGATQQWKRAARQAKALDVVVDRWNAQENQILQKIEQKESDERAQRRGVPYHSKAGES